MKPQRCTKSTPSRAIAQCIALVLACIILPHCSAPIKVKTVNPSPFNSNYYRSQNIGESINSVHSAYQQLRYNDKATIARYNFEVARLIEAIEFQKLDPWSDLIQLAGPNGDYIIRGQRPESHNGEPDKLISTDTLSFQGDYAKHTSTVSGIGAPVLAVGNLDHLGHKKNRKHIPIRNMTAVVSFKGNSATLKLVDPYQQEHITLRNHKYPLSANYSAAIMLGLSKGRIDKLGLSRLLKPSKYKDTAHLNFLQPYDVNRIPVLLVHGLESTPATFAPMLFELLQDPEIRKRYQFWVFSYPSGYPYNYSATLLRKELDEVKTSYPRTQDMIIIGHSMGSMVSRLMVTDADDTLWKKVFGSPVSETKLSGKSRQVLIDCLVFKNRSEINRAIFICGPHRGSKLASQPVRKLSSKLIRLPGFMADVRDQVVSVSTLDSAGLHLSKAPTSIDTLSPKNPFILAVDQIPISQDVTYHSIVGDRGKGDTPNSSDGVVEYWSSHLKGAQSEKIVPRNHSAHQHPEAIQEVQRILHSHYKN